MNSRLHVKKQLALRAIMEFLADISCEFMMGDELQTTAKKKRKKFKPPPLPPNPILEANLAEANLTATPLWEWPPSFKRFVRQSFENCFTEEEKNNMELAVKRKIGTSGGTPGLWGTDWDSIPALLPPTRSSSGEDQQQVHVVAQQQLHDHEKVQLKDENS